MDTVIVVGSGEVMVAGYGSGFCGSGGGCCYPGGFCSSRYT